MKNIITRKMYVWILVLLISISFVGCANAKDKANGNAVTNDSLTSEEIVTDTEDTSSDLPEDRKLIQTVNMDVETEDLDAVLTQIQKRISELKGYVESSDIQNGSAYSDARYRSANMTIRIPAKSLNDFVDKVGEISNVVSSQKTVDDITLSYVATESRMKALQAEEERLLELMAKAETMNDLLTVEKRLTEVRTELESVTSALRVFDNQVTYATIHLSIEEVKEYTELKEPETVWERIGSGLSKSMKNIGNFFKELFVFIVVASPYLLLTAIIPVGIITIVKLKNRKNKKEIDYKNKKE